MARIRFDRLPTELSNPRSRALDRLGPTAIARLMNRADHGAIRAVGRVAPAIGRAVTSIVERLDTGGRLIFVGAGTSGRLGVIEAAECPPTFNTSPGQVQAVMAGGPGAVFRSVEGSEDDARAGAWAIRRRARRGDAVVGIAASGVTPFVRAALAEAKRRGALTVLVTCNPRAPRGAAGMVITLDVGPEVLAGSTRLKAGTATKLALNTLTTAAFTRLGKVHGNRMVDLQPKSAKLRARAERLVAELGQVSTPRARRLLDDARGSAKVAIVMARHRESAGAARRRLVAAHGFLSRALEGQVPSKRYPARRATV